jgi:hypothetical protein
VIGGWAALAKRYRATNAPPGKQFSFQSAQLGMANYGSCLTIVVSADGLYLSVFPPFRFGHPPILIPWAEIHNLKEKRILWLWRMVEMQVGTPVIATLTLPLRILEQRPPPS